MIIRTRFTNGTNMSGGHHHGLPTTRSNTIVL
jgi:hypothetical protein